MNKNTYEKIVLAEGEMHVYDFGGIRLHAYQTKDPLADEVFVLEIRVESGFGCRWDLTSGFFRGFVEPYMENGYEVGWIHNDEKPTS